MLERRTRTTRLALDRASATALERRRRELDRTLATLAAHDPQRTLERGYALVEDAEGEPVTSADAARAQPTLTVRLHDGRVTVRPRTRPPRPVAGHRRHFTASQRRHAAAGRDRHVIAGHRRVHSAAGHRRGAGGQAAARRRRRAAPLRPLNQPTRTRTVGLVPSRNG